MTDEECLQKSQKYTILKRLSESSTEAYDNMCRRLLNWCRDNNIDPGNLTIEQGQNYILYLIVTLELAPRTVNSNVAYLRFFFKFVIEVPFDNHMFPYGKVNTTPAVILSENEIATFINATPNLKHKAMITLLYSCGLRIGELVSLRYQDISREHMTVFIEKSKNHAGRYVPLSEGALDILTVYWKNCGKPRDWLFPGQKQGEHISKATLQQIIKQTVEKLGWQNRHITSHTFRHSVASHLYHDTRDLLYIKDFLGHRSIASTCIYITRFDDCEYKNPMDDLSRRISLE